MIMFLDWGGSKAVGYSGSTSTVSYQYGELESDSVKVLYYGTPIAEYSPEGWEGYITGETGNKSPTNIKGPEVTVTEITVSFHITIGYNLGNSVRIHLPGEITYLETNNPLVSLQNGDLDIRRLGGVGYDANVTVTLKTNYQTNLVFGGWIADDGTEYDPGEPIDSDDTFLKAKWIMPDQHIRDFDVEGNTDYNYQDVYGLPSSYIIYGEPYNCASSVRYVYSGTEYHDTDNSSMYSRIVHVVNRSQDETNWTAGTYRGVGSDSGFDVSGAITTTGGVILENVTLRGNYSQGTTQIDDRGIFACGNDIIIGTNVSTEGYVQVYGGWRNNSVSNDDTQTHVVIFDGTFSNVVGGSDGSESGAIPSTFVNITGNASVMEAVIGGSISGKVNDTTTVIVSGNARVDSQTYNGSILEAGFSTVIGGGRTGDVTTTDVTITGNAKVFSVQGGGREARSHTDETFVTISGKAQVNNVIGSVTDGRPSNLENYESVNYSRIPVGVSNVVVKDSPTIGAVYGGGWDIYRDPRYSSTGSTNVDISDNPIIGAVFGGGFRGPVGSTNVTISGGVIGAVYGGGQGGPDPLSEDKQHEDNDNETGLAYVEGDSKVVIEGGVIRNKGFEVSSGTVSMTDCDGNAVVMHIDPGIVTGDVYGGGYGVANTGGSNSVGDSAKVTGNTDVKVSKNAVVNGSVYGGGKGVERYLDVAKVSGSTYVTIEGTVNGSVYGGGMYGGVGSATSVTIASQGSVNNNVFGGGAGSVNNAEQASVLGTSSVFVYGSAGSVYGGGDLAKVSETKVVLNGAKVSGSVYGGGSGAGGITNSAAISGGTSVDVIDSFVGGDVYGGGHGLQINQDEAVDEETVATVGGTVSVIVSDGSEVSGNVYGGGQYGRVGPTGVTALQNTITVEVTGSATKILGSVYGGGLGEAGRMATNALDRYIIINGPSISGSVYGGSTLGDDNIEVEENETPDSPSDLPGLTSGFIKGEVHINIVSGNIADGSSGNVYGGGYRGHSYLDSYVYIGTKSDGNPMSSALRINSIYGGSSVGTSTSGSNDAILLLGNTTVEIGGTLSDYGDLLISGDVFGEGDYCSIGGSSTVLFEDFDQGNRSLLSIQKANQLRIIGSELILDGNMDGSTTEGSEKLSMNLIGDLILQKSSTKASKVTINAAASQISGYGSLEADGDVGDVPDFDGDLMINTIVMNNGMILSVLGKDNLGVAEGSIRGYTLMESDSRGYYGALAIGVTENVMVGQTGFYVFVESEGSEGDYVPAQTAEYVYGEGESRVGMTMWILTGVYKVQTTVILQDDKSESSISLEDGFSVQVPKTVPGSTILFVGGYVSQDYSGSLNLVDSLDGTVSGKDFMLTVGTGSGSRQLTFGDNGVLAIPEKAVAANGDGTFLAMDLETLSGFTSTGFAGAVTLHMVEMLGNIPINTFDVEVDIYLRLDLNTYQMEQTIVMRKDDDGYSGTTDVYLPVLSNNITADYYISEGQLIETEDELGNIVYTWQEGSHNGKLSLNTVGTNQNKNGWISAEYPLNALNPGSSDIRSQGNYLGVGGVYAPVLRFEYSSQTGTFEDIVLTVSVQDEDGGAVRYYTLVLNPVLAKTVTVNFYDKHLIGTVNAIEWSGHSKIFSIDLEFGTSLSDCYVAVKSWANMPAQQTISMMSKNLEYFLVTKNDGSVFTESSADRLRDALLDSGYKESQVNQLSLVDVESFLSLYNERKLNYEYTGGPEDGFDYSRNDDWYDDAGCLSRFFFSSTVTDDTLDVYAGYTITIEIVPFITDESGIVLDVDLSVSPSLMEQREPGATIDLTDLLLGLEWTAGYEAYDGLMWYGTRGIDEPIKETNSDGHYITSPRADAILYLRLQVAEYDVHVQVQTGENDPVNVEFTMTVEDSVATGGVRYGLDVDVLVLTGDYTGLHIGSVSGYTINGQLDPTLFTYSTDGEGFKVGFEMPNGDLTVVIHLTDLWNVTVNLPLSGSSDNSRFVPTLALTSEGVSVSLATGSGDKSDSIESSGGKLVFGGGSGIGGRAFTITVVQDGTVLVDHESSFTINMGTLSNDVVYDIYITTEWTLTFDDSGYCIDRYPVNPVTGVLQSSQAIQTSGSVVVHTGDQLVLIAREGYSVDGVIALTGATEIQGQVHAFVVSGGIDDVSFSEASSEWTLTIEVHFYVGGAAFPANDVGSGAVTLTGPSCTVDAGTPAVSGNVMTYTVKLAAGTYDIAAQFPMFIQREQVSVELTSDTTVTVNMDRTQDSFKLTIEVQFNASGQQYPATGVSGSMGVDETALNGSVNGNVITYETEVSWGEHTLTGDFEGFSLDPTMPHQIYVTQDTTVRIIATADTLTVIFHDGSESAVVGTWTIGDSRTVLRIYREAQGTNSPAGWATDSGIVKNESQLSADMFTDGKLELTMIPAVMDVPNGITLEHREMLILSSELRDGVQISVDRPSDGVSISSEMLDVTAILSEDGRTITLECGNVPGTGSFLLISSSGSVWTVYTIYVIGDISSL